MPLVGRPVRQCFRIRLTLSNHQFVDILGDSLVVLVRFIPHVECHVTVGFLVLLFILVSTLASLLLLVLGLAAWAPILR